MKNLNSIFIEKFSVIPDPRIDRTKRHLLVDIIAIAICAVISGADQWIDIEAYAQEKEAWLKTFLSSLMEYHPMTKLLVSLHG